MKNSYTNTSRYISFIIKLVLLGIVITSMGVLTSLVIIKIAQVTRQIEMIQQVGQATDVEPAGMIEGTNYVDNDFTVVEEQLLGKLLTVSPIKDQGNTGHCIYNSTASAIEYSYLAQTGKTIEFDPQVLIDEMYGAYIPNRGLYYSTILETTRDTGLQSRWSEYCQFNPVSNPTREYMQDVLSSTSSSLLVMSDSHSMLALAIDEDELIVQQSYNSMKFSTVKLEEIVIAVEVVARQDIQDISLVIGGQDIQVGNKTITLDTAPVVDHNNRTLVPVRAIAEAFNCEVQWEQETQTVTIIQDVRP